MLRKLYRKLYQNVIYTIYGSIAFLSVYILSTYMTLPLVPRHSLSAKGFIDVVNSNIEPKSVMFTLYFGIGLLIISLILRFVFPKSNLGFLFTKGLETFIGVVSLFCIILLNILVLSILSLNKILSLQILGLFLEYFILWHSIEWILILFDTGNEKTDKENQ